jgi:hypothetical protein
MLEAGIVPPPPESIQGLRVSLGKGHFELVGFQLHFKHEPF